jgi:uncharacterized protein with FMN-binding domain
MQQNDRIRYFGAKTFNLVAIIVALAMFSTWATKANAHDDAVRQQIAEAERAASRGAYATDGTFVGTARGYSGPITVEVDVANGYIDEVRVTQSSDDVAFLDMCKDLPADIVAAQSPSVDTVSGATFSSTGILNATRAALRQAMGGEAV